MSDAAMALSIKAFAKINWTLDVLFRRDDGFHEIRTIYQTISLSDLIGLKPASSGIEVICDDPRIPTDESNLVHKAALAVLSEANTNQGVRIEIEKRIPPGAGLGGGSSDAAAVLTGLPHLLGVKIDESRLFQIAARLGSDVPFFLLGGTCLGIGRGEEIYPLEEVRADYLVLTNPGFEVSTPAAYAKLNRLTSSEVALSIPFTLLAAKGIGELSLAARNDFEEVVLAVHPEIGELKRVLLNLGARHALMSGSGGTVFGVFDNPKSSEAAAAALRERGFWSASASTIARSEYRNRSADSFS